MIVSLAFILYSHSFSLGLNDVCTSGEINIFAVGPGGIMLKSTNAGGNYVQTLLGSSDLNSVYAIGNNVWVAGNNGSLFVSNNLGTNWQGFTPGNGSDLLSVFFADSLTGFCAGVNGTLLKTVNGGMTWSSLTSNVTFNINRLKFVNTSTGYFSGSSKNIFKTTNGGASWSELITPSVTDLRSFDVLANEIIAGSAENNLYRSTDMGANWETIKLKIETMPGINDLKIKSASNYLVMLETGTIWNTTDGGLNFSYSVNDFRDELNAMDGSGIRYYAVSRKHFAVIRSSNSGASWVLTPNTTSSVSFQNLLPQEGQNLNRLLCYNYQKRGVLYALQNNKIFRSLNFGLNWSVISTLPPPVMGNTTLLVSAKDSSKMIVGLNIYQPYTLIITYLYRTSDNGATWQLVKSVNTDNVGNYLNFDPQHPDTVYLGAADSVFRSTDFGLSWNKISEYRFEDWCDIAVHYTNPQILYAATNHNPAKIHKSVNGGLNWTLLDIVPDTTYSEIPAIALSKFRPDLVFHAQFTTISNTGLKKSFNSGFSWQFSQFPGISWAVDVSKDNPNLVAYGSVSYDPVFLSTNSGSSFQGTVNQYAEQILYYDNSNLFVGNHGAVYKMKVTYNMPVIGIQSVSSEIPLSYTFEQNYPNPFNPVTNIDFGLPETSDISLIIYDAAGREVKRVNYDALNAGLYSYSWNASQYASGIYFCTLVAENFRETKKMILIK